MKKSHRNRTPPVWRHYAGSSLLCLARRGTLPFRDFHIFSKKKTFKYSEIMTCLSWKWRVMLSTLEIQQIVGQDLVANVSQCYGQNWIKL